jgi:predicted permease
LLIVVPSQTHGSYLAVESGTYTPSWIEWSVMAAAATVVLLIILVFARIFPLVHGHEEPLERDAPLPHEPLRTRTALAWALLAIGLVAVGLTDSFRLWSGDELDPRLPLAPVIFAAGVMMLFSTAIIYEILPARRARRAGSRIVDRARTHAAPRVGLAAPLRATERRPIPPPEPRSEP